MMMTKRKMFAGSVGIQETPTILSDILVLVAEVLSLFTKTAFSNGSITATLASVRFIYLFHLNIK